MKEKVGRRRFTGTLYKALLVNLVVFLAGACAGSVWTRSQRTCASPESSRTISRLVSTGSAQPVNHTHTSHTSLNTGSSPASHEEHEDSEEDEPDDKEFGKLNVKEDMDFTDADFQSSNLTHQSDDMYFNKILPMDMRKRWFEGKLPAPKTGAAAKKPFDTSFDHPPNPRCPLDRFMYVTWGYGQHNNQLIAMLNAFAISRELNRTLIIGPFIYMNKKGGGMANFKNNQDFAKYERHFIDPRYLYDLSGYYYKYCFVFHDDFFSRNKAPHNAHCIKPKKDTIRMFDVVCTKKQYARRQQGGRMVYKAQKDRHRLLYFPEIYWYVPKNLTRDYGPLQPSAHIRAEVDRFKREVLRATHYTAVHMRNLEGECNQMMTNMLWAINATDQQRKVGPMQCDMTPRYIAMSQKEAFGHKQIVFLATDGQDPEKDERILRYGAVRYQSAIHAPNSLFFMAIDFWLMIESQLFLPNVLSSVGWNVCAKRFADGKTCQNFFTDPHVTP